MFRRKLKSSKFFFALLAGQHKNERVQGTTNTADDFRELIKGKYQTYVVSIEFVIHPVN